MLKTAQSEPTPKTKPASTAHSNVLLASVLPQLVSPVQMDNSCLKENVSPGAQFHWLTEDAPTSVHQDSSLRLVTETVLSATIDAELVRMPQTDVLHARQVLPATEPV